LFVYPAALFTNPVKSFFNICLTLSLALAAINSYSRTSYNNRQIR
jgi:hypothetical protein